MRRRSLTVLALAALVLVTAATGCGDTGSSQDRSGGGRTAARAVLGVNANTLGYGTDVARAQDAVRRTGIRTLREELSWYLIEPRRGQRHWAATDRLMVQAAHRGMRMLVVLNGTPGWARRPNGGLPTRTAAYAAYVRDVVARYGPGGRFWRAHPTLSRASAPQWFELWNEPYYAHPARSLLDAVRYAALADAGLRAGRKANPRARFLLEADTYFLGDPSVSDRWLDRLDRALPGLLDRADGVAAHPYSDDPAVSLDALDQLRAQLIRRGHDLPVWVTEIGWSTCPQASEGCVAEARQAANLTAFLTGMRTRPVAAFPAVFVYSMHDLRGPAASREDFFGALRLNDSRKPAWRVLRRFSGAR